jgi:hypothetical protein
MWCSKVEHASEQAALQLLELADKKNYKSIRYSNKHHVQIHERMHYKAIFSLGIKYIQYLTHIKRNNYWHSFLKYSRVLIEK